MTKNEYLTSLKSELKKNGVADAAEILFEYEQHFAYKTADGYSEQEIAARLGAPDALAKQFAADSTEGKTGGKKAVVIVGLGLVDLFVGVSYLLMGAWLVVTAVFSVACAVAGICLFGGFNIYALLPSMPYWCGAVFALALIALAVLSAVGCLYFAAFMRQIVRAYGRFHRNTLAAAGRKAVLPALALYPQLTQKTRRRLRATALLSLTVFAVCFVAAYVVSAVTAGSVQFWHAWEWFL